MTPVKYPAGSFGDDLTFLETHAIVIPLSDTTGNAQLAIVPAWQCSVMTSSAEGLAGRSLGRINREAIASSTKDKPCSIPGGEDRFDIGPDYDQLFAYGASFETIQHDNGSAMFRSVLILTNKTGVALSIQADRTVRLLDETNVWKELGMYPVPEIRSVIFETINRLTNTGLAPWADTNGLPYIRITGTFNISPSTMMVIPVRDGDPEKLGPVVVTDKSATPPPDRLMVRKGMVVLKGGSNADDKIGISPSRAKPVFGSYDADNKILTLIQYTLPEVATNRTNSGGMLTVSSSGSESLSPAFALKPGETVRHMQRTLHLAGTESALDKVSSQVLGLSLQDIKSAFMPAASPTARRIVPPASK